METRHLTRLRNQ